MKGMKTCKVCGRDFALIFEEHYIARSIQVEGGSLGTLVSGRKETTLYDAFDCPHCGCQNVIQTRNRIIEEDEFTEEEECSTCEYIGCAENEEPCVSCIHSYINKWKSAEEEED